MGLSVYIYVGGVRTNSRTFYGGTRIGVHGKLSGWFGIGIPGALVTTRVLDTSDTCITDVAGWYKCTLTLPIVYLPITDSVAIPQPSTDTVVRVTAQPPLLPSESKAISIKILAPFSPVEPIAPGPPTPPGPMPIPPPQPGPGPFPLPVAGISSGWLILGAVVLLAFMWPQRAEEESG